MHLQDLFFIFMYSYYLCKLFKVVIKLLNQWFLFGFHFKVTHTHTHREGVFVFILCVPLSPRPCYVEVCQLWLMWRRRMKTSSLRGGPADGTPYTISHNPLRHRDPATYHRTWHSSTSTNQVRALDTHIYSHRHTRRHAHAHTHWLNCPSALFSLSGEREDAEKSKTPSESSSQPEEGGKE